MGESFAVASSAVAGAALVPGFPHVLGATPAPSWKQLRAAMETIGERFRVAGVETLVVISTQWFTVLGHQFQLDPNPQGTRMDENWYDYDFGRLSYDLRVDTELTERWVELVDRAGLQTRRTNYQGFPIDTGTVVGTALVDPDAGLDLALVSCNLYAAVDDLETLGRCAVEAAAHSGRRIGIVAVSGLSAGLIQRWIEPGEDAIATPAQDEWNQRMLKALTGGHAQRALDMREQFAREAAADSQFRVLAFLGGAGVLSTPAELLAYGPIWGTGAAVLHWTPTDERNSDGQ